MSDFFDTDAPLDRNRLNLPKVQPVPQFQRLYAPGDTDAPLDRTRKLGEVSGDATPDAVRKAQQQLQDAMGLYEIVNIRAALDPATAEKERAKIGVSMFLSSQLHMSAKDIYRSFAGDYSPIATDYFKSTEIPTAYWTKVKDTWSNLIIQKEVNALASKMMLSPNRWDEETNKKIVKLLGTMKEQEPRPGMFQKGWFGDIPLALLRQLYSLATTAGASSVGGTAGGVIGGLIAGPPGAAVGATIGRRVGVFASVAALESADIYQQTLYQKVPDPDTGEMKFAYELVDDPIAFAKMAATSTIIPSLLIGAANTLGWEAILGKVPFPKFISSILEKGALGKLYATGVGKFIANYGKNIVVEDLTESIESILEQVGTDAAVRKANKEFGSKIPEASLATYVNLVRETFKEVTKMMLLTALPGSIGETARGLQAQYLEKGMTPQIKAIINSLPEPGVAATLPTRAPTKATTEAPYRTPEGLIQTETTVHMTVPGGTTETLVAGDPTKKTRYGFVDYETSPGAVLITEVKNETATDLRPDMIRAVAAAHPGDAIEWNPTSEEEVALKEQLVAENPRGIEFGLQYFETAGETVTGRLTAAATVDKIAKAFNATMPEEKQGYSAIIQALSESVGMTADQFVNTYIAEAVTEEAPGLLAEHKAKAATMFRGDAKGTVKALFAALGTADFHHGVHEIFHAFERLAMTPEQTALFEIALGKLKPAWTEADLETLAQRFEDYLATGRVANEGLRTVFQQIAAFLNKIVSYLRERVGEKALSKEFLTAYNSIVTRPGAGLAAEAPQIVAAKPWKQITAAKTPLMLEKLPYPEAAQAVPNLTPEGYVEAVDHAVIDLGRPVAPQVADSVLAIKDAQPVPDPITAVAAEVPCETSDAATVADLSAMPPVEIPVDEIFFSPEVPNFKKGTNAQGVVPGEELKGDNWVKAGIPPVLLWLRNDGKHYIITGRHRLQLVRRLGMPTIFAQVFKESEGFTASDAMRWDAESNIRDGMGSVIDYAVYFRNTEITEEQASRRGFLSRDKGRAGFALGKWATPNLYSLVLDDRIPPGKAAAIASVAKLDKALEDVGVKNADQTEEKLLAFMQGAKMRQTADLEAGGQPDMFGNDDRAVREQRKIADAAVTKQRDLQRTYNRLSDAAKLSGPKQATLLAEIGMKGGNVAAIRDRMDRLELEISQWKDYYRFPEIYKQAEELAGLKGATLYHPTTPGDEPFDLKPLSDEELKAYNEKNKTRKSVQEVFPFAKKTVAETQDEWDQLSLFHRDEALQDEFNKVVEAYWGVTDDPRVTGWILSNGHYVDMAYERHTNHEKYFNRVYHTDIGMQVKQIRTLDGFGAYEGAWKAGAVRVDSTRKGEFAVQSTMVPNSLQMQAIEMAMIAARAETTMVELMYGVMIGRTSAEVSEEGFDRIYEPAVNVDGLTKFYRKLPKAPAGVRVAEPPGPPPTKFVKGQAMLFHLDEADAKQLEGKLVNFFGVTDNIYQAGYILRDGRMLDFSGKHLRGELAGRNQNFNPNNRNIKHDELYTRGTPTEDGENPLGLGITDIIKGKKVQYERRSELMVRTNAIRVDTRYRGCEMVSEPTEAQYRILQDMMATSPNSLWWAEITIPDIGRGAQYFDFHDTHLGKLRAAITVALSKVKNNPADLRMLFHQADVQDSDEWLYKSQVVVDAKMQGPMTGQALKAMFLNSGVKADEMHWLGLTDVLDQAGAEKVSKDAVTDWINSNRVTVHEVVKGEQPSAEAIAVVREAEKVWSLAVGESHAAKVKALAILEKTNMSQVGRANFIEALVSPDTSLLRYEAMLKEARGYDPDFDWAGVRDLAMAERKADFRALELRKSYGTTKFAQYTLPGGTNYREILFTLPVHAPTVDTTGWTAKVQYGGDEYQVYDAKGGYVRILAARSEADAIERAAGRVQKANIKEATQYQSPHWSEANVVLHERVNDRVDSKGRKMLFEEECQSDWHEAGREKGYAGKYQAFDSAGNQIGVFDTKREAQSAVDESPNGTGTVQSSEGVPFAPFRTTWHELGFRKLVRLAAKNGYQVIGWTTGKQQNDRYSLSKVVDELTVSLSRADPTKYYVVGSKDGTNVYGSGEVAAEELPGIIGKELAARAVEDVEKLKATVIVTGHETTEYDGKTYKGQDLEVGGAGMRGFYDKMRVDYANKLGKRFGVKVEDAEIETSTDEKLPGRPVEIIESTGMGRFTIRLEGTDTTWGAFDTYTDAERRFRLLVRNWQGEEMLSPAVIHSLPLTEEMIKSAEKGEFSLLFHPALPDMSEFDRYVEMARGFETAEAFQKQMEEDYGAPEEGDIEGEVARFFYQKAWEKSHGPAAVEAKGIPLPPREEEYNPGVKGEVAETITDPALAEKVLTGDITEADQIKAEAEATEEGFKFGQGMQALIDEYKGLIQGMAAQDKLDAIKKRMTAEKWATLEKYRSQVQATTKKKRGLKKLREEKVKLINAIMRPAGASVDFFGYADVIHQIQKGLDPDFRRPSTIEARKKAAEFFTEHPEASQAVSEEELAKMFSVNLPSLTLAQLEETAEVVSNLRKLGTLKRSLKVGQKIRTEKAEMQEGQATVLRGKSAEETIGKPKPTSWFMKLVLPTLKPDRVLQMLDGAMHGEKPGFFYRLGFEKVNEVWSTFQKEVRKRQAPVLKKIDELGFTPDKITATLQKKEWLGRTMDIDGFKQTNGKSVQLQDVLYWCIGMRNERTAKAILYGVKIPPEIVFKGISMLTEKEKAVADVIAKDFEDNFQRLRKAFIETFNVDLASEDHYVPMIRLEWSFDTRAEGMASEWAGRQGLQNVYIARGPTNERIDIKEDYQKPIRTDLFNLWNEGVKTQEGFINQDALIKELHTVLQSEPIRKAITQVYGNEPNKWLKKYINDLAQSEAYSAMQGMEKISRMARGKAAIAWLGFNLLTIAKQTTGYLNYIADIGPLAPFYLAKSAAIFAGSQRFGPGITGKGLLHNTLVDFVYERSEFVRNRSQSINEEINNLTRLNQGTAASLTSHVGRISMKGLEAMDTATVVIGWKAIYDHVMDQTKDEAKAVAAADTAAMRTQPSSLVQNMAEIYRMGEVMKWFTMFTSELSVTWNRMFFDVPAAFRRGEYVHMIGDLASFALVGMSIALASGALAGDDPEEKKKKLLLGLVSQYFEAWPIVGNDMFSLISGKQFQYGGVKMFPVFDRATAVASEVSQGDWDQALLKLVEAVSFGAGLPYSGPKRAVQAVAEGRWEKLLGWPKEKE